MKVVVIALALNLHAQTHQVLLVRGGAATVSPYLTITTSTVTPGSTINLSTATQDWRDLTEPAVTCQSFSECFKDRKAGGTGIMGVHEVGGSDPNYYSLGVPSIANLGHTSDGTVATSGSSGNYRYFSSQDYAVRAFADNQVEKTFTVYVAFVDYTSSGSPTTKTGDMGAHFTVSMSDGSVTPVIVALTSSVAANDGLKKIQIKYRSATDGQEVIVEGTRDSTPVNNSLLVFAGATLDSPATGSITRNIPMGADLQAEANGMFRTGDVQLFPDGFVYNAALTIPPRDGITMKTSLNLASGIQVLPSLVRAKISPPYNVATCALTIPEGVSHFSMDGFELTQDSSAAHPATSYGIVCIQPNQIDYGSYRAVPYNVAVSNLPSDISLTHVYVHGQPLTVGSTYSLEPGGSTRQICGSAAAFANVSSNGCFEYGIVADGNRVTIADSWVTDIVGREADAIQVRLGQHVTINNNQISSNGENVMLFASPAYSAPDTVYNPASSSQVPPSGGLFPNYTDIKYNHIFKDPSYCLIPFTKNLFENKNGKNAHFQYNLLELSCEGVFSQGQHGVAVALAIRTRNGYYNGLSSGSGDGIAATPWAPSQNIEVDHNIIRNVNRAFGIQGPIDDIYCADLGYAPTTQAQLIAQANVEGVTGRGDNWSLHDNYVWNLNPSLFGTYSTQAAYSGSATSSAAGIYGQGADNLHIANNTFLFANAVIGAVVPSFTRFGVTSPNHTVTVDDNKGWDIAKFTLDNYGGTARDVCSGTPLMIRTTGTQINNNVIGAELGAAGTAGLDVLNTSTQLGGWANFTFTNNNVQNAFVDRGVQVSPSVAWANTLSDANAAAPGQYTGNTVNITAPGGTGAPVSSLLAGECAIRYGNRAELIAGCVTPTQ